MSKEGSTGDTWLRRFAIPHSPGLPHLILCPHAGAGATSQRLLAQECAGWSRPWAVQYPGRQDRIAVPPATDIRPLADAIAAEVAETAGDDEVAVFGHSMGSLVAFEVARSCEATGLRVRGLVVSAAVAPSDVAGEPRHPTDDEGIVERIVSLAGTDDAVLADRDLVGMAVGSLRADYSMIDRYSCEPGVCLGCPVTVLGGDSDPIVPVSRLWRWKGHTTAECAVEIFPGGHFYLSSRVRAVARAIGRSCGAGTGDLG